MQTVYDMPVNIHVYVWLFYIVIDQWGVRVRVL